MIEMKIKLSEIDYGAAADVLLPKMLNKLSATGSPVQKLFLGKLKEMSGPAAKAALNALPQDTKDELAAACLNHYSEEIARLIVDMAGQKGIRVHVDSVDAAQGR